MSKEVMPSKSGGGNDWKNAQGRNYVGFGSRGTNQSANRSSASQGDFDSSSPEPTKRADMNNRSFKSAVTRAHNYTQDNYHQVASAILAKAFGYPDIEKGFRGMEKDHDKYGSLSRIPRGLERRDNLEAELEKRIKRDYGKAGMSAYNRGKS